MYCTHCGEEVGSALSGTALQRTTASHSNTKDVCRALADNWFLLNKHQPSCSKKGFHHSSLMCGHAQLGAQAGTQQQSLTLRSTWRRTCRWRCRRTG